MIKRILMLALIGINLAPIVACKKHASPKPEPLLKAYDTEQDSNNPEHLIPLNYQQAQGKRIFYEKCVWCHADTTPAGPSNRYNLNPNPPLINDGTVFNPLSDEFLENVITLGGGAMGKSSVMPPWGHTLTQEDIRALVAYIRAVAQPPYKKPAQPGPKYSTR